MNLKTPLAPLAAITLSPAFAGEPASPEADALAGQPLIGKPSLEFGRSRNIATDLPGYTSGTIRYTHTFNADFDTLPGEVSSDEVGVMVPLLPVNLDHFHLIALGLYTGTSFDTSTPGILTEDTLHRFKLPVIFLHDISDKWIWGGMVMPGFSGNQSSSDNLSISTALGFGYAFSKKFLILAGGYYSYGFHDHFAMPGACFIWRPDPLWEVYLLGPIGGVTYRANENWTLSLFGKWDSPTWHVGADPYGPDRDLEISGLKLGIKAEYHLGGLFWASLAGGCTVFRNMEIEDSHNHTLRDEDLDPAPFVEAGINLRF